MKTIAAFYMFVLAAIAVLAFPKLKGPVQKAVVFQTGASANYLVQQQEARQEVPVLCYHQVREHLKTDSRTARVYITPPANFHQQISSLVNSGWHFISPAQLVAHVNNRSPLPDKAVILSFDDATAGQFYQALPVLNKYGIKATFFVMTVVLNKPGYLSSQQVKKLAEDGHTIGCHTWDHHQVMHYTAADWDTQVQHPRALLEQLTGKTVAFFAYPNGSWNQAAAGHLNAMGFAAAFQLSGRQDPVNPLFTIRRIIVGGDWDGKQLIAAMNSSFK